MCEFSHLMECSDRIDYSGLLSTFCVERGDIAFSCNEIPSGWEIMIHVVDVTKIVDSGSSADVIASGKLLGDIVPDAESHLFNKHTVKDSITVAWLVKFDYSLSDPAFTKGRVLVTDILDRYEAQSIIGASLVIDNKATMRAVRNLSKITKRLSYVMHKNRLEYHTSRVVIEDKTLKSTDDLLPSIKMCRYWAIEANCAAAHLIKGSFANMAILYRQTAPEHSKTSTFKRYLKETRDIDVDFTSKHTINTSLAQTNCYERVKISVGITRLVKHALYMIQEDAGDDQGHWNHDQRFYTNFTSPFSRYIDILVQRQIIASLSPLACSSMTSEMLRDICKRTNHERSLLKKSLKQNHERNISVRVVPMILHVYVKGITVEKEKAYVNLENIGDLKFPISTLLLSNKKRCTQDYSFNTCSGNVTYHPTVGCRRPFTFGLMDEMYITLTPIDGKLVARF